VVVLGPRAMKRARLIMNPVSGDDQPNAMKLPDIVAAVEAEDIRADLAFTKPDEFCSDCTTGSRGRLRHGSRRWRRWYRQRSC